MSRPAGRRELGGWPGEATEGFQPSRTEFCGKKPRTAAGKTAEMGSEAAVQCRAPGTGAQQQPCHSHTTRFSCHPCGPQTPLIR